MTSPTPPDLAQEQHALLKALLQSDGYAGNVSLRRRLGWDEERYWRVRDSLVDAGLLARGRGKGGTVRVVGTERPEPAAAVQRIAPAAEPEAEGDLYDPIAAVLRGAWARDNRYGDIRVEITARQGRRPTGGIWTRPDLVVAAVRVFPYVPGRHFDLITFEVKPSWGVTLTAVYEALAHRRAATQAYVWFHTPEGPDAPDEGTLNTIVAEAERHGVGVIAATQPGDYDTWDTLVSARRAAPEPEALNDFVAIQLSDEGKQDIVRWIR
jgi:hypothetical protein